MSWISSTLDSFFNPQKGYDEAAKKMEQYWKQAQQFQEPYRQAGVDQLPILTGAQSALLDPSKLLGEWMGTYEASPYAQKSISNATDAGMNAASSMGLIGSSPAITNIQNSAGDIMNKDRQQYLDDLMNKYMTGIGVGQNIYGIGAQTAGNMGNQALNVGQNMGQAAYGSQNAQGDMLAQMMAMAAKMYMQKQTGGTPMYG